MSAKDGGDSPHCDISISNSGALGMSSSFFMMLKNNAKFTYGQAARAYPRGSCRPSVHACSLRCARPGHLWAPPALTVEELQWVTNPLPGTSEDPLPKGESPSEVEVGEEATAIPPASSAARCNPDAREDCLSRSAPVPMSPADFCVCARTGDRQDRDTKNILSCSRGESGIRNEQEVDHA